MALDFSSKGTLADEDTSLDFSSLGTPLEQDEKGDSLFSMDRAKQVGRDLVSLIPGMGDVAEPVAAERKPQMTPQQIERAAAIDATDRENLRAINPGAEDYQINALLDQKRAARENPMPAPTVDDRAAGYMEKSAAMTEEEAVRNAQFDIGMERKLNERFQKAEADPITGERIAVAYQPERDSERTAAKQEELDVARDNVLGRAASEKMGKFLSGLAKSGIQMVGAGYGTAALIDHLLGDEQERDENLKTAADFERYVNQLSSAKNFTEIRSAGDAGGWLAENSGYVLGQAAMALASGGIGKEALGRLGAPVLGEIMGLAINNASLTFGSVYSDAMQTARANGTEPPPMWQILAGSAASMMIDTIADKFGMGALTKTAMKGRLATRIGKSTAAQVGVQGGTEAAQLVPEEWGAGRDPFREGMQEQYINEGAVGALGGAGPGIVGGIQKQATPAEILSQELSSSLEAGLVDDTQAVVDFANRNYTTSDSIRPESTSRAAALAVERDRLESMRVGQQQVTQQAVADIGSVTLDQAGGDLSAATDAVIELAANATRQGAVLADITSQVSQNDQLQQTLAALGAAPVETTDATPAQLDVGAGPAAVTDTVGGLDAAAGQGQPQPIETLTFKTPELALRSAMDQGIADQVEISDTGNGFVLAPKVNAPTLKQLNERKAAIDGLTAAIEQSGGGVRPISVRSSFVPVQAQGGGGNDAAGAVGQTLELVSAVVGKAFGSAPIPVSGLGEFGVAYGGKLFIDVDEASAGDKAGNSGVALAIATIGHESTHALLQQGDAADKAAYKTFRSVVLQHLQSGVVESRRQKEQAAQERVAGVGNAGIYGTTGYAESEVVADVSGAMWLDSKFWGRLYDVDNGSTMRRVMYRFMQAATKFMEVAKGSRLDVNSFVTNLDAVREAAAQAWAQRAGKTNPPAEIAQAPTFSKLGVSAEVAPDPRNTELAEKWNALKPADQTRITQTVMNDLAPKVLNELGLPDWKVEYTTGSFEGQVNPSALIRASEGATVEQLGEAMRVFGYVLDQKGMVAFDEGNTTSENQAGFVKVVLPKGLSAERIDAIRQTIASAVPQAEGDTLRDGALVYGNFSAYNNKIETLSDEQFYDAIANVLDTIEESTETVGPFRFHSEYDQAYWGDENNDPYIPEGRKGYLEKTRYANNQTQAQYGRDGVRGWSGRTDARARIESIAAETDRRIQELVAAVSYSRPDDAGGRPGNSGGTAEQRGASERVAGGDHQRGADAGAAAEVRGAIHFGQSGNLTSLSGASFGTGIKGAEQERLKSAADARIKKRVYFYLPVGGGKRVPMPEIGLGVHVYTADLDGLYDPAEQKIRGHGNAFESAVLDAGYKGYINREQGTAVVLNANVPVKYQGTSDQFEKVKRTPTVAKPKQATRTEGQELVRRPEGQELSQIVKARDEITFAAPSFKLQYGEARVLASEAAAADQILAESGSTFQFGAPAFSRDMDEYGAFNLDSGEFTDDFLDGIEVSKTDELDFDALQAELDAEMNRGRRAEPTTRNSIEEPTDQEIKDAGIHLERIVPFGQHKVTPSNIVLDIPGYLKAQQYQNYEIRRFGDEFSPSTDIKDRATFISGGKRLSEKAAVEFTQRQLAQPYLNGRNADLNDAYRKGTILKIAEGWLALSKKAGAFKNKDAETKSTSFPEIAMAMGLFKGYRVTEEYGEYIYFKDRKSGQEFNATIIERSRDVACCTMGLNGSNLGSDFYVVAGKLAQNLGKAFVPDESLSVINTYRRTEQALSFALRTGDTSVLLPGPQNRVYGYVPKPETKQDHSENIARLALANLRNVEEMIPDVRRWSYDPATSQFVDGNGESAEASVSQALTDPDVRAMGIGRSTIARAVLTSDIIKGKLNPGEVDGFDAPVLYSRITEDKPQPLSESWGQLNADGTVELSPEFVKWYSGSDEEKRPAAGRLAEDAADSATRPQRFGPVDANGVPLVFFHGTRDDITVFDTNHPNRKDKGWLGRGIYGISDADLAADYASIKRGDAGQNVMPLFFAVTNPYKATIELKQKLKHAPQEAIDRFTDKAKALGHDGVLLEHSNGVIEVVAFEPTQVKSAIGNNGNFDPANPDIRYSRNDIEDYMVGRNRGMKQVSGAGEQDADINKAMQAIEGLAAEMKPVHERLSKQYKGEDLQKAVMSQFRNYVLPIGRTPHTLTMLGAPNSMMKIDPSIVYKVFVDKHANDLEGAKAKDIVEAIYKPAMVLKGRAAGEFELVLPVVTSTGPLLVPVMTGAKLQSNGGKATAIMSIYPRKVSPGEKGKADTILQRVKDGGVLYADPALAQVALTGNAPSQAGINVRGVSQAPGTPPARTSNENVTDSESFVKPINPYYVGWDKASKTIMDGIAGKTIKTDLDLMKWIGNNFKGDWNDAPSYSRGPGMTLDPEGFWLKKQRVFQDYFNRVNQVQQQIAAQGGVVREENNTYLAEERSYGRINEQIKEFADKWVKPMVEKAAKADVTMDELSLYAYAMHAKERNARIASINQNMPDGGSGMTNAEADAIINQFNGDPRAQAIQDLHGDLMAITATTRRVLLEDGLITDEQYAQLDGMYGNYVPLRGFENESDPRIKQLLEEGAPRLGTGQGFSIKGNETMRALGRRTKAGDIIENIINDYQRAVVRGEKNQVARHFYQFVLDNPAPNLWEIDADKTKRSLGLDGQVKEKVVLDTDDNTTVVVKIKGNEIFVKVKDPLLVRAIKKMHNNDMGEQLRTLTNGLAMYTSLMRNTLTRFNPEFAIVNLVRDAGFGTMAVLDELGEAGVAKFWKHYAAANAAAHRYEMGRLDPVKNAADKSFTEYRMAGGTTGGFYMKDADEVRGDIRDMMLLAGASPNGFVEKLKTKGGKASPYRMIRAAGRVLEHVGSVSENAARAAAFRAAREMGKSPAEAARIAKNLTTNFNRKGEYGQLLNTLFVFYNAAIQGGQRTAKMFKNPKAQGYLAGMVASSMAIALANAWGAGDDEDDGEAYWDKIPAHVKERNLIIMLPHSEEFDDMGERIGSNGRYIAIPVQYGLNIFTTLGYSLADMVRHYGEDKTRGHGALDAGLKLASVTMGSFNPFGGSVDNKHAAAMMVLPSAADVVYQLATGVNAFGTPVSPFKSELDAKPDSENVNARQAGGTAHRIAKWINAATGGDDTVAGAVDLSPGTMENIWGNLTGGTGRFINDVATLAWNGLEYANGGQPDVYINKVPVARKIYGEVDGGVDQGLFYDRRREIQEARQEEKAKEESGREVKDSRTLALASMSGDANKFTREIGKIRKQMVEIGKDDAMTTEEKRKQIRELKQYRDILTREFNRQFIEVMREEAAGGFDVEQ